METMETLATVEIVAGRERLISNSSRLSNIAKQSEDAFQQSQTKEIEMAVVEQTQNCVTHALASVAEQISNLAFNLNTLIEGELHEMKMLDYEVNQLQMKGKAFEAKRDMKRLSQFISRKFPRKCEYKRKTRRHIRAHHKYPKYISTEVDFSILDKIGHGMVIKPPEPITPPTPHSPLVVGKINSPKPVIADPVWLPPTGVSTSPKDAPVSYAFKGTRKSVALPSLGIGESIYSEPYCGSETDSETSSSASPSLRLKHDALDSQIYSNSKFYTLSSVNSKYRPSTHDNNRNSLPRSFFPTSMSSFTDELDSSYEPLPSNVFDQSCSPGFRRASDTSDITTVLETPKPRGESNYFMFIKSNRGEYATFEEFKKGTSDDGERIYEVPPLEPDVESAISELEKATASDSEETESEHNYIYSTSLQEKHISTTKSPKKCHYNNSQELATTSLEASKIERPQNTFLKKSSILTSMSIENTEKDSNKFNHATAPGVIPPPPPFDLSKIKNWNSQTTITTTTTTTTTKTTTTTASLTKTPAFPKSKDERPIQIPEFTKSQIARGRGNLKRVTPTNAVMQREENELRIDKRRGQPVTPIADVTTPNEKYGTTTTNARDKHTSKNISKYEEDDAVGSMVAKITNRQYEVNIRKIPPATKPKPRPKSELPSSTMYNNSNVLQEQCTPYRKPPPPPPGPKSIPKKMPPKPPPKPKPVNNRFSTIN